MSTVQKINPIALKVGDNVVVYGKLRRMFHKDTHHTFTGNIGKVHSLPIADVLKTDDPGIWVKIPGVTGQFYATPNHCFSHTKTERIIPENAVAEGQVDNVEAIILEVQQEVKEVEKPFYKYPADAIDNKGLQEIRSAFAMMRHYLNGDDGILPQVCYDRSDKYETMIVHHQGGGYRVQYAFVMEDGKSWVSGYNGCYGKMYNSKGSSSDLFKVKGNIAYVVNFILLRKDEKTTEVHAAYLKWLLNDSPWSMTYITKDPDDALLNGIVVDANYPGNLVTAACIATRWTGEHVASMNFWYEMVKHGMPPHEAMWMSEFFYINDKRFVFSPKSDHTPFGGYHMSKEAYNNYLNNKPITTQKDYSQTGQYSEIRAIFGGGASTINWFDTLSRVTQTVGSFKRETASKNPFGEDVYAPNTINTSMSAVMAEELMKICNSHRNKEKE